MKTAILRNKKNGKSRILPIVNETRNALGVGDENDPIWIPLSQAKPRNMMHLTAEERIWIKDELGFTLFNSNLYEVKDWIWREKNL